VYESTSDEKLRELTARPQDLTEAARLALEAEVERRGLFEPDVDPPLAEGATPCADHPQRAVVGTCSRCGRFICYRCDGAVGAQLRSLPAKPSQGLCGPCRALAEKEKPARPIGGWLILLAIGLVLSPFTHVKLIYESVSFFRATEFSALGRVLVLADIVFSVAFFGLTIWTAVRFFSKKKDAPNWMAAMFAGGVAQLMLQLGFEHVLAGEVVWSAGASRAELIGTVARAAVWIPYLKLSKRVKETFINP
jgi:Protein of unknown function (DUF2569)